MNIGNDVRWWETPIEQRRTIAMQSLYEGRRNCAWCGREFRLTENPTQLYCNATHKKTAQREKHNARKS